MNTYIATDFLYRCFRPGETIALLLRREEPAHVAQRIVRLDQATAPAYMRWLAHENASGMNVYVAANPLRVGSRKRTKACIVEVRHLYLDIDLDGDARFAALLASKSVPKPTAIVSTSPGKYQVLWRVAGFDFALQEQTLKQLSSAFGGDAACTDCNRVIRIPGLRNAKYTPAHLVTVEYLSDSVANPRDFRVASQPLSAPVELHGQRRRSEGVNQTQSEEDWAWVLAELRGGVDPLALTRALAHRRSDKPNPLYYAQRTVDVASARLAITAGTTLPEVVSELEARRSAELSKSLCSARAREIAQTAAHMIARLKLA